jgi:hypothetical protein
MKPCFWHACDERCASAAPLLYFLRPTPPFFFSTHTLRLVTARADAPSAPPGDSSQRSQAASPNRLGFDRSGCARHACQPRGVMSWRRPGCPGAADAARAMCRVKMQLSVATHHSLCPPPRRHPRSAFISTHTPLLRQDAPCLPAASKQKPPTAATAARAWVNTRSHQRRRLAHFSRTPSAARAGESSAGEQPEPQRRLTAWHRPPRSVGLAPVS